jgi:hypothetical protein
MASPNLRQTGVNAPLLRAATQTATTPQSLPQEALSVSVTTTPSDDPAPGDLYPFPAAANQGPNLLNRRTPYEGLSQGAQALCGDDVIGAHARGPVKRPLCPRADRLNVKPRRRDVATPSKDRFTAMRHVPTAENHPRASGRPHHRVIISKVGAATVVVLVQIKDEGGSSHSVAMYAGGALSLLRVLGHEGLR